MTRKPANEAWLAWISGVIVSCVTTTVAIMVFLYSSFETSNAADKRENHILETQKMDRDRLIRIEDKLDILLRD